MVVAVVKTKGLKPKLKFQSMTGIINGQLACLWCVLEHLNSDLIYLKVFLISGELSSASGLYNITYQQQTTYIVYHLCHSNWICGSPELIFSNNIWKDVSDEYMFIVYQWLNTTMPFVIPNALIKHCIKVIYRMQSQNVTIYVQVYTRSTSNVL